MKPVKPVRYRFVIKDINDNEVGGFANSLFTIKRITKHFDFRKEVRIINNRTGVRTTWRY